MWVERIRKYWFLIFSGRHNLWDFSASGLVFVALTFARPWRICYLGVSALLTSRQYQLQGVSINDI